MGGNWLDAAEAGGARPEDERWPLDFAAWRCLLVRHGQYQGDGAEIMSLKTFSSFVFWRGSGKETGEHMSMSRLAPEKAGGDTAEVVG